MLQSFTVKNEYKTAQATLVPQAEVMCSNSNFLIMIFCERLLLILLKVTSYYVQLPTEVSFLSNCTFSAVVARAVYK